MASVGLVRAVLSIARFTLNFVDIVVYAVFRVRLYRLEYDRVYGRLGTEVKDLVRIVCITE